jgi:hypothetical protein
MKYLSPKERTPSEASRFGGSHNYETKTKQTTFLHREIGGPKGEELYTSK